ncbi:unnamed protein product, partial [Ectocarpus sp. 12 AP-2014]
SVCLVRELQREVFWRAALVLARVLAGEGTCSLEGDVVVSWVPSSSVPSSSVRHDDLRSGFLCHTYHHHHHHHHTNLCVVVRGCLLLLVAAGGVVLFCAGSRVSSFEKIVS